MLRSVRTRLTLCYVLALAVVLAAFSAITYLLLAHRIRERVDSNLRSLVRVMAVSLEHEIEENGGRDIGEHWFAAVLATVHQTSFPGQGIAVYEGGRRVAAKPASDGFIPALPARVGASPLAPGFSAQTRGQTGYRVAAARVVLADYNTSYTIAGADGLAAAEAELAALRRTLGLAAPAVLLLIGAGAYVLVARTLAPVVAMSESVERITARNLSLRVPVRNPGDELGRLAVTFNRLLDRLERSFDQQRQFTADASHELRTPISIAQTAAQVSLEVPHRSPEDYREALAIVRDQTGRLTRLVNDMLQLARVDAGVAVVRKEEFYFDELIAATAASARVLAGRKGVTISLAGLREAPCRADENLVRQLLLILLDNAIKYTPEGGSVVLTLEKSPAGYIVRVADTGIGIPPAAQPHIFDRFYRADPARPRGGAGLGLAIGRWIAEAHQGSLELTSSGSHGSVFTFRLPAHASDTPLVDASCERVASGRAAGAAT